MARFCQILLVQASLLSAIAFVIPARDVRFRRQGAIPAPLGYSNYDDPNLFDSVASDYSWSQEEDWALIDGVRTFSIGGGGDGEDEDEQRHGRRYTFWDRLVRTSPKLSSRSVSEVRQRYEALRCSDDDEDDDAAALVIAGPSPQLLHDWWVRAPEGEAAGAGGTLDDGRVVWFPLRSLGRFDGHVLDSYFGPAPPTLSGAAVPGGYAEAVGGQVYELGTPRAAVTSESIQAVTPEVSEGKGARIFQQTAVASLAALAAAALLSIAVGFGAGLEVSSQLTEGTSSAETQPYGNFGVPVLATAAPMRTETERSISELRAQQEVKVLRERRIAHKLGERLNKDEVRLEELRLLEREAMRAGNTGD